MENLKLKIVKHSHKIISTSTNLEKLEKKLDVDPQRDDDASPMST